MQNGNGHQKGIANRHISADYTSSVTPIFCSGAMEFFRYKTDAWGQRVLEGASWDLIWVFLAAAAVFIVAHAIYVRRKTSKLHSGDELE